MRGWKVKYSRDEGRLSIGPGKGKASAVKIVGVGRSSTSDYLYLVFEEDGQPSLTERHEEALLEYLNENHEGPWELVPAQILTSSWHEMTELEKERVLRREGFEATSSLP